MRGGGGGGEVGTSVFVLLNIVGTIYILSSAVILKKLLSERFTKEQSFSGADILKKHQKLHFRNHICDRRDDAKYVLDHSYPLPIATQPYIIDNEPFSIYSEIEIHTEVDTVQNEVLFDYTHLILFH